MNNFGGTGSGDEITNGRFSTNELTAVNNEDEDESMNSKMII